MTISKLPPGTLNPSTGVVADPGMPTTSTVPGKIPPYGSQQPFASDPNATITPITPPTGTVDTGAKGVLQTALDQYGLGSLADWAWHKFQGGESVDTIIGFDLIQTPEFKAQFPEYAVLAQRGQAMSPGQIVQYRTNLAQLAQQYGVPADVDTRQLSSDFLLGNVSIAEVSARFAAAQTDILTAPPENLAEINRLYGMTSGDLLASYIDPNASLPLLQRKAQAAALGVQSERTGYGQLGAGTLEQLNLQGVTQSQAQQGFGQLASERQLFQSLDRGEGTIGQDIQLGAEFGGNAQDQATIQARQARRKALFSEGGGFATGRSASGSGVVGV